MKEQLRFEAVMVRRLNPRTHLYEYLVLDYEPKDPKKKGPNGEDVYGDVQVKFPGGRNEPGEESGEAASRELSEETGFVIATQNRRHMRKIYTYPTEDITQDFYLIDRKYCGGRLKGDVQIEGNSRISNRRWVPENELYTLLWPSHREAFKVAVVKPRTKGSELAIAC